MNDMSKPQLEELRTRALASLRLLLGGLSVNGESHLLAMAKKAVSNAEQAEYRDAVQAYRLKWKAVEGRFVGNVEAAFLARQVYEPWYEGVIAFRVFDDEASARAWLAERLAAA